MKTYSTLSLFFLTFLSIDLTAQTPVFEWAFSMGESNYETEGSSTIDDAGFIYLTGSFSGTIDFDPGPETFNLTSNGEEDIFLQKLDPQGNFVWVKSFGGSELEQFSSIAIDANNDLYLTGSFSSNVDFDPSPVNNYLMSNGGADIFLVKLDTDANLYWARSFGGPYDDYPTQINVDNTNNVILTGRYGNTVDFDPGVAESLLSANGGWDAFILKLDQEANFIWARSFGGTSFDTSSALTNDSSDNIYLTGHFAGTADFDPTNGVNNLESDGLSDVFILKLDASGQLLWVKQIGGSDIDLSVSVDIDPSGHIITTGDFRGTVDFSPGTNEGLQTAEGDYDAFILKLDLDGNFIWVRALNSGGDAFVVDLAVDQANNYYVVGQFSAAINFEVDNSQQTISANSYDMYVFKIDPLGDFIWGRSLGGDGFDALNSISVDTSNNIILMGSFENTVDFDPGNSLYDLSSNGQNDFFIMKWSQDFSNSIYLPSKELDINFFPNPSQDFLTIDKKDYSEVQLKIFDTKGRLFLSKELIHQETSLDLSTFASGLYFIHFEHQSHTMTKAIFKNTF